MTTSNYIELYIENRSDMDQFCCTMLDYVISRMLKQVWGRTSRRQRRAVGAGALARKDEVERVRVKTYLIFVIFFTRAKFLENKIYTKKRQFFALIL